MAQLSKSVANLPSMGPGSTDKVSIKALQDALVNAGYLTSAQVASGPGVYGTQTTAAVAKWQTDNGINTAGNPGYFGPVSKNFILSTGSNPSLNYTPYTAPVTQMSNQTPYVPPSISMDPNKVSGTIDGKMYNPAGDFMGSASPAGGNSTNISINNNNTNSSNPLGLNSSQIQALQQALVKAGYMTQAQMDTGPGIYGPQTAKAYASWQETNANKSSISPTSSKSEFSQTPDSQIISTDSNHTLPEGILPPSMQNLAIYNLPQEAFQSLVPQLIPGTSEYQNAMDKLSTAYFDVMQQQINAQTEQDQQLAQYNWETLKKNIEKNFNISLSNDAFQAWDQIQGLRSQYGQQNIEGSGLQNEAIDSYLRKIRQTDAIARTENQSKEESSQQDYYMKFATPEQVKAFALANPEKAKAWGLIPSDSIRQAMNPATLRAKYPTMSDQDIQSTIASILDENGNYRSALYQKHMTGSNVGINMGNVDTANIVRDQYGNPVVAPVKPSDTGVLDINAAKQQYQTINTPLASQSADYDARVRLGSIPPTSGANSGTSAGTQFNKINPDPSAGTPPSSNPPVNLNNPINVPGATTASGGTSGTASAAAAAANMGTGTVTPPTTSSSPASSSSSGQTQYYKIQSSGEMYAKDPSGVAKKVASIPTGAGVINWTGTGLPYGLNL